MGRTKSALLNSQKSAHQPGQSIFYLDSSGTRESWGSGTLRGDRIKNEEIKMDIELKSVEKISRDWDFDETETWLTLLRHWHASVLGPI